MVCVYPPGGRSGRDLQSLRFTRSAEHVAQRRRRRVARRCPRSLRSLWVILFLLSTQAKGEVGDRVEQGEELGQTKAVSQNTLRGQRAQGPFLSADLGLSFLGETGSRERIFRAYALGFRGGYRWGSWGAFGVVEPAYWSSKLPTGGREFVGVLNLGVGGEYLYAERFVRTAMSVGTSTLTRAGALDEPGSTGFFFEFRPSGLRWALDEAWRISFDPILFSLMVPVLDGIPLIEIEYRSTVSGEFLF